MSQVPFVLVLVLVCGGGRTSLLLPYTSQWKGGGDTVRGKAGKVVVAWKGGSDTSRRWTSEKKLVCVPNKMSCEFARNNKQTSTSTSTTPTTVSNINGNGNDRGSRRRCISSPRYVSLPYLFLILLIHLFTNRLHVWNSTTPGTMNTHHHHCCSTTQGQRPTPLNGIHHYKDVQHRGQT